jgi:hypothetical protein
MRRLLDRLKKLNVFTLVIIAVAGGTILITGLLVNIFERKSEARNPYVRLVEVTEDDTDPSKWGTNWPKEYDSYKLTAQTTRTRFGGHGEVKRCLKKKWTGIRGSNACLQDMPFPLITGIAAAMPTCWSIKKPRNA